MINMDGWCRRRRFFNKPYHGDDIGRLNELLSRFGLRVDDTIDAPAFTTYVSKLEVNTNIKAVLRLEQNFGIAVRDNNVRVYLDGDKLCIEKRGTSNEIIIDDLWRGLGDGKLNLMVGIDNKGNRVICNLANAPHMLVAGTTGSGKSVFLHSCIMSILIGHPKDVNIVGIDPKGNEFLPYSGLNNFKFVSHPTNAMNALKELCEEMDSRYHTLAMAGCRDIDEYNRMYSMKRIVCVVDELADLMYQGGKQIEGYIVRLAQKARACGIHLILATQRPSADVVTGLIKTNIPTRVCLAVESQIDSRIILDQKGGEKLTGKGDMLFKSNRCKELIRCQGMNFIPDEQNTVIMLAHYTQTGRDIKTMPTKKQNASHA